MKTDKGQMGAKETVCIKKALLLSKRQLQSQGRQVSVCTYRVTSKGERGQVTRRLCSRCCPASGAPLVTTSPSPPLGSRPGPDRQLKGVGGERGDEGAGQERHTVAHLPDNKPQLRVASEGT